MKKLFFSSVKHTILILATLVFTNFTSEKVCNDYFLDNQTSCDYEFTLTITDLALCNVCHGPSTGENISSNVNLRLPCGMCINQCNITITITGISGFAVSGPTVDFNTTTAVSTTGCNNSTIVYNPSTQTIIIS